MHDEEKSHSLREEYGHLFNETSRFDILYGFPLNEETWPIFPCEKCKKESCKGKKECKGFGAYRLGIGKDA